MNKFIQENWLKVIVIAVVLLAGGYYGLSTAVKNNNQLSSKESTAVSSPQELLIENKGFAEFNAENNTIDTVSPQDKEVGSKLYDAIKSAGNLKDLTKIQPAIDAVGAVIKTYPDYSDAYFLRAMYSIILGSNDYKNITADIDNSISYHSLNKYQSSYNSTAPMYALRAKVDMLSGDYQQAMNDLETAVKNNPTKISDIFQSGGVKPEDITDTTALFKTDYDTLIKKYPNDYRAYLFRGLFYDFFTRFDKGSYCTLEANDLQAAISINPNSAMSYYFLGKEQSCDLFSTVDKASDSYRNQVNEKSLEYFNEAIKVDPNFIDAYAQSAEQLFELKRYSEAIPYYDKVIELDANNSGAYNDRGLSKTNTNDFYGAISDFSKAIEIKPNPYLDSAYQNRADAYIKVADYSNAIDDYSRAIGLKFASQVFLMSLAQIRTMYPEFNDISDKDLLEGLRQKYLSNMSPTDFSNAYQKDKKPFTDFVIGDLYTSRGDAYLLAGNFKNANKDYARAIYEGSTSIMDRWRSISKNNNAEYFIDSQTIDFSKGNIVSLWLKSLDLSSQNYTEQNFQIDCSSKTVQSLSSTSYDSSGNVTNTTGQKIVQSVVPESIGEVLYSGMCK